MNLDSGEILKRIHQFPIKDASVSFNKDCVVVQGIISSWHTKQLVSREVMSIGFKIDNQLKVVQ